MAYKVTETVITSRSDFLLTPMTSEYSMNQSTVDLAESEWTLVEVSSDAVSFRPLRGEAFYQEVSDNLS
jgi:hypothetical protein